MVRRTSSAVRQLGAAARNAALVATAILALVGLLAGAVRVSALAARSGGAVAGRAALRARPRRGVARGGAARRVADRLGARVLPLRRARRGARSPDARAAAARDGHAPDARRGAPGARRSPRVALVYGSDASAPGRVVDGAHRAGARLVRGGQRRPSRTQSRSPISRGSARPTAPPRVVGSGPGQMATVDPQRASARVAGDFRALELDDARVSAARPRRRCSCTWGRSPCTAWPRGRAHRRSRRPRARSCSALTAWLSASVAAYVILACGARRAPTPSSWARRGQLRARARAPARDLRRPARRVFPGAARRGPLRRSLRARWCRACGAGGALLRAGVT